MLQQLTADPSNNKQNSNDIILGKTNAGSNPAISMSEVCDSDYLRQLSQLKLFFLVLILDKEKKLT